MTSHIISEVQSSCEMFAIGREDHTSAIAVNIYQSKAVSHFPVHKLINSNSNSESNGGIQVEII